MLLAGLAAYDGRLHYIELTRARRVLRNYCAAIACCLRSASWPINNWVPNYNDIATIDGVAD